MITTSEVVIARVTRYVREHCASDVAEAFETMIAEARTSSEQTTVSVLLDRARNHSPEARAREQAMLRSIFHEIGAGQLVS